MPLTIWTTKRQALAHGCTHHAMWMGLIPGFIGDPDGDCLWIPRSDLLIPLEIALNGIWNFIRECRGEQPDFMFELGEPIHV